MSFSIGGLGNSDYSSLYSNVNGGTSDEEGDFGTELSSTLAKSFQSQLQDAQGKLLTKNQINSQYTTPGDVTNPQLNPETGLESLTNTFRELLSDPETIKTLNITTEQLDKLNTLDSKNLDIEQNIKKQIGDLRSSINRQDNNGVPDNGLMQNLQQEFIALKQKGKHDVLNNVYSLSEVLSPEQLAGLLKLAKKTS